MKKGGYVEQLVTANSDERGEETRTWCVHEPSLSIALAIRRSPQLLPLFLIRKQLVVFPQENAIL